MVKLTNAAIKVQSKIKEYKLNPEESTILLERTVRASMRRKIANNEYSHKNSAATQRKYRSTEKGRAAVKRQNDKVVVKARHFLSLAAKLAALGAKTP